MLKMISIMPSLTPSSKITALSKKLGFICGSIQDVTLTFQQIFILSWQEVKSVHYEKQKETKL